MFGLSWIEVIYWISTIVGGTLFILRTIMMLTGGPSDDALDSALDSSLDLSGNVDLGGDIHTDTVGDHPESDTSFKLLSLQGLTAFFMIFGLVGLALTKANLHPFLTMLGATSAGFLTVWVISIVFWQMRRLQTEGTIFIKNTIGATGEVYLTIPEEGSGQVRITVQGSLKIFDAASNENNRIATGEKIQVINVAEGNTLIVKKIQPSKE